jgi:hypothetical protein
MITTIWHKLSVGSLEDARQRSSANPLSIQIVVLLCPEEVVPHGKGITSPVLLTSVRKVLQ